ncbi:MAG: shikimate dehydrogenase family protein [Bacteroidota bacterium]
MKRYGLIGYPLSHSFSQRYFSEKFAKESIYGAVYENYSIPKMDELKSILEQHHDLCGFNVTIPYKKEVLAFLSSSSPVVKAMGACNCVKVEKGQLIGHNTDVVGFEQSLLPYLKSHHREALILGTGGAAAAVAYVLRQRAISFQYVSRKKSSVSLIYEELNEALMNTHTLIINTTPLGMSPQVDAYPAIPYQWISSQHHCFDLIYNPAETIFLQKAKSAGASTQNGAEMLVIQAEESWRIWNEVE